MRRPWGAVLVRRVTVTPGERSVIRPSSRISHTGAMPFGQIVKVPAAGASKRLT